MIEEISVDGMKVCIALPCYSGYVPLETCLAFAELVPELNRYGVTVSILAERGNSLPTTARNNLLTRFLETDSEYLFWIDDDIIFTSSDFLQILAIAKSKKSVAATYPARKDIPVFFIKPLEGDKLTFDGGLIECKGVGLGFACQHRSLLETLASEAEAYLDKDNYIVRNVFKTDVVNGKFRGEDFFFFNQLYERGQITYVHPSINLKHAGRKDYDHRLMTEKGEIHGNSA